MNAISLTTTLVTIYLRKMCFNEKNHHKANVKAATIGLD